MSDMTTFEVQAALRAKGFDPGPLDGIRGRKTIDAIMAFQQANQLVVDGIAGPATQTKLAPAHANGQANGAASLRPWMIEASRLMGVVEDTSAATNPLIAGWGREIGLNSFNDETPWCGLFVAHCIGSQLPSEPLPSSPLRARAWERLGNPCTPQPGAIMVFWRETKSSGLGHVGFYVSEDNQGNFFILGGNQSNAVNVDRKPRNRFIGARWPKTAPAPSGGAVLADATGRLDGAEV